MSFPNAAPSRRRSSNFGPGAVNTSNPQGDDLSQSLRQLSLSAGTPTKSKSPSPLSRSSSVMNGAPRSSSSVRSPSVASTTRRNSFTPRSPLPTGRESRAGTPNLLRKASTNSLHSASGGNSSSPSKTLTRRASANNLKSPSPRSPLLNGNASLYHEPLHEEQQHVRPLPPTASDIARKHFESELQRHASAPTLAAPLPPSSPTVVILHDACYGHRFSRPRTSRANLGTIVERPERIQACAVGVAAAYVRLGGRHADDGDYSPSLYGGKYMPHPQLDPLDADRLPDTAIPFRIHKTARSVSLLSPAVTNVHGVKWMEELKIMCDAAEAKLALNGKELQRPLDFDRSGPHGSGDKPGAPPPRLHEGDLYLCEESLQALQGALGGVCEAVDTVFGGADSGFNSGAGGNHKRAFVAIRPPGHHCSSDWPSGFCWINNVHVGIMHGILTHGLTHAAIVDIDLHHGDGSQAIAWQHNTRSATATKNSAAWKKTSIGYFSLHDINSFPCEAGDEEKVKNASLCVENAHGQTVWNVHLESWKTEAEFWALYEHKYTALLTKLRTFMQNQAAQRGEKSKSVIFISAGFDASEWESAGMQRHKVNVPTEFYARFTRDVVQIANDECDGRVISVLEGGYSDRALFSGVLSHVSGLAGAEPVTTRDEAFQSGLGFEMGGLAPMQTYKAPETASAVPYDPAWWAAAELDRIEEVLAPPPPPEPKAERAPHPSTTYSSPTASSQARVASTAPKMRRSMSGLSGVYSSPTSRPPSPPPPPPPEVPWTVAMHELSKLLIPSNRSTGSCTVEDLAAEATRARRERQVLLGGIDVSAAAPLSTPATPLGPKRVSQRERKQVKPFGSAAIKEEAGHNEDHRNRRKTVAGTTVSAMAGGAGASAPASAVVTPARGRPKQIRRLSAASALDDLARGQADAAVQPIAFAVPPVPAVPAAHAGSVSSQTSRPSSGSSMAGRTTRPQSSMSAATGTSGSVASGGGGAGIVPGAATAAPPSARKPRQAATPKSQSPRKKAVAGKPVPAPKPHVATPAPTQKFVRKVSASGISSRAGSAGPSSAAADMDRLTTGMRKIKINVVTAAQKEEREKARKQAEEARARKQAQAGETRKADVKRGEEKEKEGPATPRLSATPLTRPATAGEVPVTPLAQTLGAPTLFLTEPEPEPELEPLQQAPPVNELATSVYSDFASASDGRSPLLTPSETTDAESSSAYGDSAAAPAVFIPYQPEGTPQRQTAPASTALHWMPPNEINTPAPSHTMHPASSDSNSSPPIASPMKMKRSDLPVFTSTSSIPFAPPGTASRPTSSGQ
ncbi:histone deacetylase hos3 [Ophiostoma piceae UAMH 11346]|uniref:Histone deacetylase hos3 n=1 Tax=Ophiostoma piceae (strain UAMH 11346) TaxID=1262450 RepID=S3CBE0_OPHP1|nr:histone deacetylase hos3 [Ophiostoma piceae UAMH 11346]